VTLLIMTRNNKLNVSITTFSIMTLGTVMLSIANKPFVLSVITLTDVLLNVVTLRVVILNVSAPLKPQILPAFLCPVRAGRTWRIPRRTGRSPWGPRNASFRLPPTERIWRIESGSGFLHPTRTSKVSGKFRPILTFPTCSAAERTPPAGPML